jgi:phosphoribosylaminoimidazole-succinocarboxamide synthase
MAGAMFESEGRGLPLLRRGKVRDVYQPSAEHLLIVACDRISAFDHVLPTPIPDKGKILTQISNFWFEKTAHIVPNHIVDPNPGPQWYPELDWYYPELDGRTVLVRATKPLVIEAIVRGYLSGSGWKEYQKAGTVCGIDLPAGLTESAQLPEAIFTPSTKAQSGHDENISFEQAADLIGADLAAQVRDTSLALYTFAAAHALERGIIIADTKFEFGILGDEPAPAAGAGGAAGAGQGAGQGHGASPGIAAAGGAADAAGALILIDEILTPDSSRFWPADDYEPGRAQASYDKQYVRDYLEAIRWNKEPPAPELPPEVVEKTREKYWEAARLLTSRAGAGRQDAASADAGRG